MPWKGRAENERRIQDAITRLYGQLTIVVIAHSPSTVGIADHVVVLDCGRLADIGAREEAIARQDSRFHPLTRTKPRQSGLGHQKDASANVYPTGNECRNVTLTDSASSAKSLGAGLHPRPNRLQ